MTGVVGKRWAASGTTRRLRSVESCCPSTTSIYIVVVVTSLLSIATTTNLPTKKLADIFVGKWVEDGYPF